MNKHAGFTLIELLMVIVILAILAATAVPSFVNVSGDARQAASEGMADALGSAAAVNFAIRSANSANGVAVPNCVAVAETLQGGLDADYSITEPAAPNQDGTLSCTVAHVNGESATFIGLPIR